MIAVCIAPCLPVLDVVFMVVGFALLAFGLGFLFGRQERRPRQ
jgi:hypothetical protein